MKKINIKLFLIPFVVISLMFLIFSYKVINTRIEENLERIQDDAFKIAQNYSDVLTKSYQAGEVINSILDEKIIAAGKIAALYEGNETTKLLADITYNLNLTDMYLYDAQGKVILSSTGEYIGWQVEDNHPIAKFMRSGEREFIEEIRADTETGEYYKFGYYRIDDGRFYQVRIKGEIVQDFLKSFLIEKNLDDIYNRGEVDGITFYNKQGQRVYKKGNSSGDIEKNNSYQRMEVPVYIGNELIGSLSIFQSNNDFLLSTRKIIFQGVLLFLFMMILLFWVFHTIYAQSKKYYNLAYFDQLTGLPNYDYLTEFLASKKADDSNKNQALFLISLRNLKNLNLTYGFKFGEEIIVEVADRLKNLIGTNGLVFKYNLDQFALFIESYTDVNDLLIAAEQITGSIEEPFSGSLGNQYMNPAIGILELGGFNSTPDMAIKNVFTAMTIAKKNPYHSFIFYDEKMEKKLKREDIIEKALRKAVTEKDYPGFYLEYQPKLNLKTNKISGFEALARLKLDDFGNISPLEFIDVAERSLLISILGKKIYSMALDFVHKLEDEGYDDVKVAINISGIQLTEEDFPDFVIEGDKIEFEITESVLLDNFDRVNEKLSELRRRGVTISLDDFGTGFSSMSRLRDLNVDVLKIDKVFTDRIGRKDIKTSELITPDIISMAHKLGLKVVAEGVETQLQKEFLVNHNCDIIQGYYYSKPLSEENAIDFIKRRGV